MKPTQNDVPQTAVRPDAALPGEKKQPLSHNKKLIGIIVAAIALIAGGVTATMLLMGRGSNDYHPQLASDQQKTAAQNDTFTQQYLHDCKQRDITFTHLPVPTDQLGYIEPMGKTYDGHVTPVDHMYVVPKNMNAADNTTDVVMPADGTVIQVDSMPAQYIGDKNQQTAPEDHRLVVAHNCRYVSIFIHVHKLADALQSVVGAQQPGTQKQVGIELKAGDKLGKIGGNPVDWTLADATKTLSGFITPDLYKGEPWKVHAIDPSGVYTGSAKDAFIAKSLRSTAPYGGKIDYDKKGALSGNWFRDGTNGYAGADQSRYWDGHLAITPNYIDSSSTGVSLGNWQGKAAQFTVKGTAINAENVTAATGPVKYELIDVNYNAATGQAWAGGALAKGFTVSQSGAVKGTAMFQVLDGERLKVELFPGKTASQVTGFTSAAQTYVR